MSDTDGDTFREVGQYTAARTRTTFAADTPDVPAARFPFTSTTTTNSQKKPTAHSSPPSVASPSSPTTALASSVHCSSGSSELPVQSSSLPHKEAPTPEKGTRMDRRPSSARMQQRVDQSNQSTALVSSPEQYPGDAVNPAPKRAASEHRPREDARTTARDVVKPTAPSASVPRPAAVAFGAGVIPCVKSSSGSALPAETSKGRPGPGKATPGTGCASPVEPPPVGLLSSSADFSSASHLPSSGSYRLPAVIAANGLPTAAAGPAVSQRAPLAAASSLHSPPQAEPSHVLLSVSPPALRGLTDASPLSSALCRELSHAIHGSSQPNLLSTSSSSLDPSFHKRQVRHVLKATSDTTDTSNHTDSSTSRHTQLGPANRPILGVTAHRAAGGTHDHPFPRSEMGGALLSLLGSPMDLVDASGRGFFPTDTGAPTHPVLAATSQNQRQPVAAAPAEVIAAAQMSARRHPDFATFVKQHHEQQNQPYLQRSSLSVEPPSAPGVGGGWTGASARAKRGSHVSGTSSSPGDGVLSARSASVSCVSAPFAVSLQGSPTGDESRGPRAVKMHNNSGSSTNSQSDAGTPPKALMVTSTLPYHGMAGAPDQVCTSPGTGSSSLGRTSRPGHQLLSPLRTHSESPERLLPMELSSHWNGASEQRSSPREALERDVHVSGAFKQPYPASKTSLSPSKETSRTDASHSTSTPMHPSPSSRAEETTVFSMLGERSPGSEMSRSHAGEHTLRPSPSKEAFADFTTPTLQRGTRTDSQPASLTRRAVHDSGVGRTDLTGTPAGTSVKPPKHHGSANGGTVSPRTSTTVRAGRKRFSLTPVQTQPTASPSSRALAVGMGSHRRHSNNNSNNISISWLSQGGLGPDSTSKLASSPSTPLPPSPVAQHPPQSNRQLHFQRTTAHAASLANTPASARSLAVRSTMTTPRDRGGGLLPRGREKSDDELDARASTSSSYATSGGRNSLGTVSDGDTSRPRSQLFHAMNTSPFPGSLQTQSPSHPETNMAPPDAVEQPSPALPGIGIANRTGATSTAARSSAPIPCSSSLSSVVSTATAQLLPQQQQQRQPTMGRVAQTSSYTNSDGTGSAAHHSHRTSFVGDGAFLTRCEEAAHKTDVLVITPSRTGEGDGSSVTPHYDAKRLSHSQENSGSPMSPSGVHITRLTGGAGGSTLLAVSGKVRSRKLNGARQGTQPASSASATDAAEPPVVDSSSIESSAVNGIGTVSPTTRSNHGERDLQGVTAAPVSARTSTGTSRTESPQRFPEVAERNEINRAIKNSRPPKVPRAVAQSHTAR